MRVLGMLRWLAHPGRIAPAAYLVGWAVGTLLLMSPAATESGEPAGFWVAAFTAMSALCITGLAVVDTPSHWSAFGEVAILGLIQVGGLGIMTLTSLIIFSLSRRASLAQLTVAQAETRARTRRGLRAIPIRILVLTLAFELVFAAPSSWCRSAWRSSWVGSASPSTSSSSSTPDGASRRSGRCTCG